MHCSWVQFKLPWLIRGETCLHSVCVPTDLYAGRSSRVHQNIKKLSEFQSNLMLVYMKVYMKEGQKCKKNDFWGIFLAWPPFCRKWIKQTPTPPFWGDVGVKKWSWFFDSGTRSPIFGHLKMGTFGKSAHFLQNGGQARKMPQKSSFLHFWSPFI